MIRNNPQLRFAMPVIWENIATTAIGLVLSSIIGGISGSALAAVTLVNSIQNTLNSATSFLTVGSAVVTARLAGEGNFDHTTRAVEQSFIMAALVGMAIMALCEISSVPVMRLLLPKAEPQVFEEGLRYYQSLMLSFPFLVLSNTLGGVLRAAGDSKSPMLSAIALNVVQVIAAYLMIPVMKMNVVGAGLSYLVCRVAGAIIMFIAVSRHHRYFRVRYRNFLRPDWKEIAYITRIGAPSSVEGVSIQGCYLIANSLVMGIGTFEASVYQVCAAVNAFANWPQSVTATIGVTYIGHSLGAKQYDQAVKQQRVLLFVALVAALTLEFILIALAPVVMPLFAADPAVQARAVQLLWWYIAYEIVAILINVNDPVLRTAGDLKYVMWYTMGCCWLIRLPMTWLLCYHFHLGATGMHLANVIALTGRAAFGEVRILQKKWPYLKLDR